MNRLSKERSPYLSHAASQKIDWYPWSQEAFDQAKKEDKPVFLSSGAVWCHWCHVMAKECFENEEIAGMLNENFISVKLDRDERPDIDKRYQRAVAAMGQGSGWPLSIFLTPEKKPFFGGTYFPPEDHVGRPGFKTVLRSVVEFYKSRGADVTEYGERLLDSLRPGPAVQGEISASLLDEAETAVMGQFDGMNGGFGPAPKFPMPGALEFLMLRHFFSRDETVGNAIRKTLESMAKGGFHDQLGGGFHRYSVDEAWTVPHFEKMTDDNAWLLRNYIYGYSIFGDPYFRKVAEGTTGFVMDVLSDPDGGFYASQDADVTPDDEGGYFIWDEKEFRRVLDEEEFRVLSLHLLHERAAAHHDLSKRVLLIAVEPEAIAEQTGIEQGRVLEIISCGKDKLLKERDLRPQPFVDKTFYTSLNGMMISAFLLAYRCLGDDEMKEFALKSLDRILDRYCMREGLLHTDGVGAVLDDYVYVVESLLSAYEVTGEKSYFRRAVRIMDLCIEGFWDADSGGFFDTSEEVLGLRLKSFEDIPHPSSNPLAVVQLMKLYHMTGKDRYLNFAEKTVRAFSGQAREIGIHAGYYFCGLDAYHHMFKLTLEASPGGELARTALSFFIPYKGLVYGEDRDLVTPCLSSGVCLEPVRRVEDLRDFLAHPA
ncbi:MAG: thioredoxin domain-containing protein [Candidatus Sulfobium sp.]